MKPISEHKKFESIEAYLAYEEKSEVRHEYYLENLIEMAGSTKLHNQIVFFLTLLFRQSLLSEKFDISSEQVKAFIKSENIFFYPDVMVCHPNAHKYYSDQPILLVEVLSESTRTYDLTDKFIQYKQISSLYYYWSEN